MAERDVFALLVGIDKYAGAVPDLAGCANDITAIGELLQARVTDAGDRLHVVTLINEQATREAVIASFRSHLGQTGPDDVALFYYSGHGSQEPAPPEFWPIEPDHLDETLVLHDSRTDGGWDLADKELAALLREISGAAPHVVVVLDCCHSGSGTRAVREEGTGIVGIRRAPTDRRERPLSSYLFAGKFGLTAPVTDFGSEPGTRSALGESGWAMPDASHVLLAGCRSNETAKETMRDGTVRGAMSVALEQTLSESGAGVTYRDLHRQVGAIVRADVREQNPQLEAASDVLDAPFLGGAVTALPGSFVLTRSGGVWQIDGGRMHGIAPAVGAEATRLAMFAAGAAAGAAAEPVATGIVTDVRAAEATVVLDDDMELEDGKPYRAVVTATPLPPMLVAITGDPDQVAALHAALADRDVAGPLLVAVGDPAAVRVSSGSDGFRIVRSGSESVAGPLAAEAKTAVAMLESIAQWQRVASLRNGATRLDAAAVTLELDLADPVPAGAPLGGESPLAEVDGGYRISYDGSGPTAGPRTYRVTVTNGTNRTVFFALLDLTDTFGIYCDALPAGSERLDPGTSREIRLAATVPDELFDLGITQTTDLLKLIVSTAEFDPRTLQQEDLPSAPVLKPPGVRAVPASTLDRLLQRVGTRRAQPVSAHGELIADWFTRDLLVTAVRPGAAVPIVADADIEVAPGVRIAAHPAFTGAARLAGTDDATRDLAVAPLPPLLADPDDTGAVGSFVLTSTRGSSTDALVIDTAGADVSTVTADNPLVVTVDRPLAADEHVLPFAWDGEFYIPLGYARAVGERTEVVLQRLSAPVVTSRSLFGSIRILFRKIIGRPVGLPYKHPLLRLVTVAGDGIVGYDDDLDHIRDAVEATDAVVLYVHGILGDTAGMARSSTVTAVAPPPPLIGSRYGAILTFDYENLHTTIEENATALQQRLRDVGLDAHHGKRLDIIAHSMGGLVSRYLIEFVGGVRVHSLTMLGTPNGGSPWPVVQKWAAGVSALAVNMLTAVVWPVTVLAAVVGVVERVDNALDQMEPGSTFLNTLSGGADPGVPYTVIVGNDSLLDADPDRTTRLLQRVLGSVADVAFFFKPNDLAVAVTSARNLPAGRNPEVQFIEIACDHMTFFATGAGLTTLAGALD